MGIGWTTPWKICFVRRWEKGCDNVTTISLSYVLLIFFLLNILLSPKFLNQIPFFLFQQIIDLRIRFFSFFVGTKLELCFPLKKVKFRKKRLSSYGPFTKILQDLYIFSFVSYYSPLHRTENSLEDMLSIFLIGC